MDIYHWIIAIVLALVLMYRLGNALLKQDEQED